MDGDGLLMVDTKEVPLDCRMPNTLVWVVSQGTDYKIIEIKKMTESEAKENPVITKFSNM